MGVQDPSTDNHADADRQAVARAVATAESLLRDALDGSSGAEQRRSRHLRDLLAYPETRRMLFELTDSVLRIDDADRAMARLRTMTDAGLPRTAPIADRLGLRLAAAGSRVAPALVDRLVTARVRSETRGVILPGEDPALARHLRHRRDESFDLNVNLLGEAIVGDAEADRRFADVTAALHRADVDYVSVKISSLCANLDVLAFDASTDRICERLERLYRAAMAYTPHKFVNLDMEAYNDLHLTVAAFRRVLDEPEFTALRAGIVFQAYLPDSHAELDALVEWATRRRASGGEPPKVRLVKGANLGMERVEAEIAGWEPAPYPTKADVDSSYKRLLDVAVEAAADGVITVGVGSHNLFDVAWALERRGRAGAADRVRLEMLEGMAPAQARAARDAGGGLLLYAPVVARADFAASIAYLARRLDENAAPENFLHALFSLEPGSPAWTAERVRFERSVSSRSTVSTTPRHTADRTSERRRFDVEAPFTNEPDTDFTLASNRSWITGHLDTDRPQEVPSLVDRTDAIDELVDDARHAATLWAVTSTAERRRLLTRLAEVMAARRGRTIAVMAHETAKTVREADVEVSEAIDFARWAADSTHRIDQLEAEGVACDPVGVTLVAGPWNFPYAIPANGVFAAIASGGAALLKPAPEARATALELIDQITEAGAPPGLVHLVVCPDDEIGRHLVTHDGVDAVILTGAHSTAQMFLDWKPALRLSAETSGKNAMIVTAAGDVDLAIADLLRSAFGHAGQKCSAASLVIVEASVHDRTSFLDRLADAVRSIRVGPANRLDTMMGPIVGELTPQLHRALTRLDDGERWLVEPHRLTDPVVVAPHQLWTPGVRVGVRPGSWYHQTECFGPVLGVMRATDLDDAIGMQNGTPFGLTGGLASLDPTEIEHWLARVEVGNAYVNRHITGAIVGRQPFGGWKRSSVGGGTKAGGPDDVFRLVRCHDRNRDAVDSADYRARWAELSAGHDRAGLRSQSNVLRRVALTRVILRIGGGSDDRDERLARAAAAACGVIVETSDAVTESDAELAARISSATIEGAVRLRALTPVGDDVLGACHRSGIAVVTDPISAHPDVELRHWSREQAVSTTLHRHGRLPE